MCGNTHLAATAFPHSTSPSSLCSIYCSCHRAKQRLAPEQTVIGCNLPFPHFAPETALSCFHATTASSGSPNHAHNSASLPMAEQEEQREHSIIGDLQTHSQHSLLTTEGVHIV